jgi:hypothetical protein
MLIYLKDLDVVSQYSPGRDWGEILEHVSQYIRSPVGIPKREIIVLPIY